MTVKARERRENSNSLKNEIKLVNCLTHTLFSLSSLKFSKIGIGQMRKNLNLLLYPLTISLSLNHSLFIFFCFMQDSKTSPARKPWYQRAMAVARFATNWRTIPKSPPPIRPSRNPSIKQNHQNQNQLRKCTSLKVAANSFTRVCLCAPIGPYDDVFRNYVPPRRSSSYPPSRPLPAVTETAVAVATARMSVDSGRRFFRGKSLKENALMRRFVAAEEEAMMENKRRDQMEIVRKRNQMRKRKKLGPSPLSRMVIAEEEDDHQ